MKARLRVKHRMAAAFGLWLFALILPVAAAGDTILFPVIAVNTPNVITVVSVMNLWPGGTSSHLKYTYKYKDALVDGWQNIQGGCSDHTFVRPTLDGDLVSFDASGSLNGGYALFGDRNSYGGGFALPGSGPRRAYLLVTNSNSTGTRIDVGSVIDLAGEAIVMDIATGAAWGMKAINDLLREDYLFIDLMNDGGVAVAMTAGSGGEVRRFSFFPPDVWSTRFFITPIGGDMRSDWTAEVNLLANAVFGRTMDIYANANPIVCSVRCTAAVDVEDLYDSTVASLVQNTGGWSVLRVASGSAVAYKLEYVLNDPTYGGTSNNGFLLSGLDNL